MYLVACTPGLAIIVIKKTAAILKSLDIARTIPLPQFSYIEQYVGLDCGIE